MADYEYHIFLSYRRWDEDWVRWTQENLVRELRRLLCPALGDVRIFVDQQINTGADWPMRLAQTLARSRLLIPLFCPAYFQSDWCTLELAIMRDREQQCGLRTPANPEGLILPLVIYDGSFPSEVQAIQQLNIWNFANPSIQLNSTTQQSFSERLHQWCPCIVAALQRVPPYDPAWETLAIDQFRHQFQIHHATQTRVPGLSLHQAEIGASAS